MSRSTRTTPTGSLNSPVKTSSSHPTSYAQTAKQVQKGSAKASVEENADKKPPAEVKAQPAPSVSSAITSSSLDGHKSSTVPAGNKLGSWQVSLPKALKKLDEKKYNFLTDNEPINETPPEKLYPLRSLAFGEGVSTPGPRKAFTSATVKITATFNPTVFAHTTKETKAANNPPTSKKNTNAPPGTSPLAATQAPYGPFVPSKHPAVPHPSLPAPGAPFSSPLNPLPSVLGSHSLPFVKQPISIPGSAGFPQPTPFGQFAPPHGIQPVPPINGQPSWNTKPSYTQGVSASPNQPAGFRSPHSRGQDKPAFTGPPGATGFTPNSSPNPTLAGPGMGNSSWNPQPFYPYPYEPNYSSPYPSFVPQVPFPNPHIPPLAGINGTVGHLNTNAVPFTPKASKAIKIINPNTLSEVVPNNIVGKKDSSSTTPVSSTVRISKPGTSEVDHAAEPKPAADIQRDGGKEQTSSDAKAKAPDPVTVAKEEDKISSSDCIPESDSTKSTDMTSSANTEEKVPVETISQDVYQDPTIITTSEAVLLTTKAKPKRSIRAESKIHQVAESKPADIQPSPTSPSKKETVAEAANPAKPVEPQVEPQVDSTSPKKVLSEEPSHHEESVPGTVPGTVPGKDANEGLAKATGPAPTSRTSGAPPGFEGRVANQPSADQPNGPNGPPVHDLKKPVLTRLTSSTPSTPGRSSPTPNSPRTVEFFEQVSYPPNINRPKLPDGKFKYDRKFLLQFREMCIGKPEDMKLIDFDDNLRSDSMDYKNNNRGHMKTNRIGGRPDQMNFTSKPKSSEERFNLSNLQMRNDTRSPLVSRTSSSTMLSSMNNAMNKDMRNRGGRGGRGSKHGSQHFHQHGRDSPTPTIPLEDVVPLKPTENRWTPKKAEHEDKETRINRKGKALLNKLTLEKFDAISKQLIDIANESSQEHDGQTLKLVIKLIFEKATDEPNFSAMYAQLCCKMQQELNPDIYDEEIKGKDGQRTTGGILFRKYLLTRCQSEFMKGWKTEEVTKFQGSVDLLTDEYYIAAKAKRQGLGLIRFIGELFKLGMLTERIMHECLNGMLQKEPDEEEIESLFKLLTTIGKKIDVGNGHKLMNNYFNRISDLIKDPSLTQRGRFMLQDLIDLRKNHWELRRGAATGPKTLQEIKDDADKEAEEKSRQEKLRRTASSSGRGQNSFINQPRETFAKEKPRATDGWNTVGGQSPVSRNKTTGDLSSFGNLSRSKTNTNTLSLGPSSGSVFTSLGSLKGNSFRESPTTSKKPSPGSLSNMFGMLADADAKHTDRPTLKLLPKTSSNEHGDESFKLKIENTAKELFSLRDMKEATLSLNELAEYSNNDEVVHQFALIVIEKKLDDVNLIANLFGEANSDGIISFDDFVAGLKKAAPKIDDISIDSPAAFDYLATIMLSYPVTLSNVVEIGELMNEDVQMVSPGSKLFVAYVKALKKSTDEAEEILLKEYDSEPCNLTRLFHKDSNMKECIERLIKNVNVAFLVPSITSSAWYSSLDAN